jgi:UDP-N-acetylmuramoylalanine--D-glutamate ligase
MKIAIFGLARSGLSAMKFLATRPEHELFLVNQGEPATWSAWEEVKALVPADHCVSQQKASELFADMDQIILSPGIPRYHQVLKAALAKGVEVISEIEMAFRHSDIPVISITGTNGKTTTATMVAKVLQLAGKKVFLGGNIGIPYSEILFNSDYDIAVVEASSFQLESIESFHPHIAMLLNITHNHAERYDSFDDYAHAKYEMFKNMQQNDHVLIDADLDSGNISSQLHFIQDLEGFDFSKSKLVGSHNRQNFYCAWKVLELLNIVDAKKIMQEFIHSFTGVEYRLQFIGEYQGLSFYNDGKSTNNAATESAVRAFQSSEEKLYLILGGKLRSDSVDLLDSLHGLNIEQVFVMGEAAQLLQQNLQAEFKVAMCENLEQIFAMIKEKELKGNLLFSPAFPSFDQYKNYEARGAHFTRLVQEL